jgi:hypothetical protein
MNLFLMTSDTHSHLHPCTKFLGCFCQANDERPKIRPNVIRSRCLSSLATILRNGQIMRRLDTLLAGRRKQITKQDGLVGTRLQVIMRYIIDKEQI